MDEALLLCAFCAWRHGRALAPFLVGSAPASEEDSGAEGCACSGAVDAALRELRAACSAYMAGLAHEWDAVMRAWLDTGELGVS